jgi:fluoride ion exporter CrcB/FEX
MSSSASSSTISRLLTELYILSYLIFFSIFGTLARLGVQWITFYPGAPVTTPVLWANTGGSFIMGFLSADTNLFLLHHADTDIREKDEISPAEQSELMKTKKSIPLYIGLGVGFCGSFTSFSSFARDVFLALSNDLPSPISHPYTNAPSPSSTNARPAGYSVESVLAVIFYTLALSIGGFIVGTHLASALHPFTPKLPPFIIRKVLDPLMIFLGFGCWLGAVLLSIFPPHNTWRGEVLFALVLAPSGCILRYYLSQLMNGLVSGFPLGTFTANIFGTAVEAMCYSLQHVSLARTNLVGGGVVGCQVLQGVMDGFCGCLTTVSTWVAELVGIKRKRDAYAYALASVSVALGLCVVIMGSVRWSVGWEEAICRTGYPNKVNG